MSKSTARRNESPATASPEPEVLAFRAQFDARSSLDTLVREGAQKMLQAAIDSEVEEFIAQRAHKVDENGKRLVVRNGYLPPREVVTGAGALEIQQPRARDNDPDCHFAPETVPAVCAPNGTSFGGHPFFRGPGPVCSILLRTWSRFALWYCLRFFQICRAGNFGR